MAGVKISALPAIPVAPALTDIFPEVQPASGGTTYKSTFTQLLNLFQPNIPLTHAGNPNSAVAGTVYQFCWDTTNSVLYVCTTTGDASSAVWTTAGSVTFPISMAQGGTGANLTAANGAIPYSTASAFALLAPGTTGQLFRSGGAGAPTWTTSTYPATNAINTLLYASSANVMSALATGNSGALVTSAGGVPSISTQLPGGMTIASDPSTGLGIATKQYVDNNSLSGTSVYAVSAGSLGTVTQVGAGIGATLTNAGAQATFALDGVNPPVGSSVLIKNTATGMTAANEGIYTVTNAGSGATNWVLTRDTDYDTPTEINDTGIIVVQNGSTLAGTGWYNANTIAAVDVTNFNFVQFGTQGTVTSVGTAGLATGGTITTSGTITVTAAVAGDMTTGTSTTTAVTPAVSHYSKSAVQAWAYISTGVGPSFGNSYNASGVVRNATGKYTVSWTTAFAGGYACLTTCMGGGDTAYTSIVTSLAVGSIIAEMWTIGTTPALTDGPPQLAIMAMGPLSA